MVHILKCYPEIFDDLVTGKKTFELRFNDRGYKAGDVLKVYRCKEKDSNTVDKMILLDVTFVLDKFKGLEPGFVIMSIRLKSEAQPLRRNTINPKL